MRKASLATAAVAITLMAQLGASQAQEGVQPSETTETFGAWTVRCQKPAAEAPRACEVLHAVQGQGGAIAQVAIGTPPGKEAPLLVVQVPLGILVATPVAIADQAAADKTIFSLPFQTCLNIGCLAQIETSFEALETFAAIQTARVTFAERSGRSIELSVPVNGLKDALARLRKI